MDCLSLKRRKLSTIGLGLPYCWNWPTLRACSISIHSLFRPRFLMFFSEVSQHTLSLTAYQWCRPHVSCSSLIDFPCRQSLIYFIPSGASIRQFVDLCFHGMQFLFSCFFPLFLDHQQSLAWFMGLFSSPGYLLLLHQVYCLSHQL